MGEDPITASIGNFVDAGTLADAATHNMVELEQLYDGIGLGVYEAIAQFQAQAASVLR